MARLKAAPSLDVFSRALIGIPRLVTSEASNDFDVSFPVPNNIQWLVESIYVEYTSENTGSDRQLEIQILDHLGDVIGSFRAGKEQAVNTVRKYMFAPGLERLTAFYDTDYLTVPLPFNYVLREGWVIRVFDNNAVSATDDMDIQILVREMDTVNPDGIVPATARRAWAFVPPVEQLTITSVKPIIESKSVIPVEQLVITTVKPHMGEHRNVGTTQLAITPTASPKVVNFNRVPGKEDLTITPVAPTILEDFPHIIPAEQLVITSPAPSMDLGISPGAAQLTVTPTPPFNT